MTVTEMNNVKAVINRESPETAISFIDTNTGAEVTNIPILNIPFMSDEKWQSIAEKQRAERNAAALAHNQAIVNDIMADWGCTELEAWAALEYDTDSLEKTQFAIAQAITYNRHMKNFPLENARFLREEYYKGKPEADDEDFIQSEAKNMAEEMAWDSVYTAEIVDDYDEMTEAEKEAVVYGTSDTEE